jgi:hypothetical protein
MPFTPAHAAAALPFRPLRLVTSALVVGTMAPDFEYFIRLSPGSGFDHTFAGAVLLSLPLALVVLWIFHTLLKVPLVQLFPDAVRLRLAPYMGPLRFGGPPRFALIAASALIGIATHIAWDAFTHPGTWPYRHIALLRGSLPVPFAGPVASVKILQLGSSAVGIVLLAVWLLLWYRRTAPSGGEAEATIPVWQRWLVIGCIAAAATLGGVIRGVAVMDLEGLAFYRQAVVADGVVTAIALSWWLLVVYAIVVSRRRTAGGAQA